MAGAALLPYAYLCRFRSESEHLALVVSGVEVHQSLDRILDLSQEDHSGNDVRLVGSLPADISGLSCPEGEVDNSVFDRYLVPLYKQASYKPYIIAAMIFLAQVKDPVKALMELDAADNKRKMF